jgi:hypothetical protein
VPPRPRQHTMRTFLEHGGAATSTIRDEGLSLRARRAPLDSSTLVHRVASRSICPCLRSSLLLGVLPLKGHYRKDCRATRVSCHFPNEMPEFLTHEMTNAICLSSGHLALGHFWGNDFPHSCQPLRVRSPWVCLGNRCTVRARNSYGEGWPGNDESQLHQRMGGGHGDGHGRGTIWRVESGKTEAHRDALSVVGSYWDCLSP